MMKRLLLLWIITATSVQLSFGQQKVIGEPALTERELELQNLWLQGAEYGRKYNKAIRILNLSIPDKNEDYSAADDLVYLTREIKRLEDALYSLSGSNARIYAQQADNLLRQAQKSENATYTANFDDKKSRLTTAVSWARVRKLSIEQQNKKQQAKLDFLATDTRKLEKETDELARKNNTTSDFLSKSSSSSQDFLSSSGADDDARIEIREGRYGVVSQTTGKVLFAFRDRMIKKYTAGIALVSIRVDRYSQKCPGAFGTFSATAYKTGYVDTSESFIDGYEITFDGGFKSDVVPGLTLVIGGDNRSVEEKRAAKRRNEQKRSLAKEECREEYLDWQRSVINTYK